MEMCIDLPVMSHCFPVSTFQIVKQKVNCNSQHLRQFYELSFHLRQFCGCHPHSTRYFCKEKTSWDHLQTTSNIKLMEQKKGIPRVQVHNWWSISICRCVVNVTSRRPSWKWTRKRRNTTSEATKAQMRAVCSLDLQVTGNYYGRVILLFKCCATNLLYT